jgi:hypothetical protein
MGRIRTKWYEYCDNCSYQTITVKIGIEWVISCQKCPKVVITEDITKKPE